MRVHFAETLQNPGFQPEADQICAVRISGMPTTKYRCRVLWRKRYIPAQQPTLPPSTARRKNVFSGTRQEVRKQAVEAAIKLAVDMIE